MYDVTPGPPAASLLAQANPAELSSYELIDAIKGWDRLAAWAQANQAKMVAELASRRPPAPFDDGFKSADVSRYVVEEISCALSLTRRGAENRLSLALEVTESLPGTLAAWERGDLDWSKVNMIADRTGVLDRAGRHRVEESVLPRAAGRTAGQLRKVVDRAVIKADPAAADSRHERERLARDVTITPCADGMSILGAYLCAEEAAAAYRVLQQLADNPTQNDPRSSGQRRADALMHLITGAQSDGLSTPVNQLGKPLVHLVVSADTVSGRSDAPAELLGHGPISTELARRLAADGTWQRILTDPNTGDIIDVGRTRYRPPAALTDYIRARDQVCTFPTCQQPATKCDLDHSVPFRDNGRTSAANLTAKCRRHHLVKHHAGWTTVQHTDGTITWTSPTGHRYDSESQQFTEYVSGKSPPPPARSVMQSLPNDPPF